MRIAYIWSRRLPSRETDGQQIVMTVDGLVQAGAYAELVLPIDLFATKTERGALQEAIRLYYNASEGFRARGLPGIVPSSYRLEHAVHPVVAALQIRRSEYDVFYTRSRASVLLAAALGWPVVFETYRLFGKESPKLTWLLAGLARRDRIVGAITHSDQARRSLADAGFPAEKLATVHNGYDPRALAPRLTKVEARERIGLSGGAPVVCYTGHVSPNKGLDAVLQAAARTPDVRYLIVGGRAADLAALRGELAQRRDLSNVIIVGWKPAGKLGQYLYAADVLMIPTASSPLMRFGRTVLPMKVFTYLAAGRAIIAPALPDLEEVLQHGRNALLVRPDDPASTAHAVRRVLTNASLRRALSKGALADAANRTWQRRGERIIELITSWRPHLGGAGIT